MEELTEGVLKKDEVKEAEPRQIGAAGSVPTAPVGPNARVTEQDDARSIVEVRCTCGRIIQLQCNYAQQTS